MRETEGHFPGKSFLHSAITAIEGEHLVHWELERAIYHISFHLADSVPEEELRRWRECREHFNRILHEEQRTLSSEEVSEMKELYSERIERYLSAGHGSGSLGQRDVAEAVAKVLEHDHSVRYNLHEWTIMPNHVHVIVAIRPEESMKGVVDQWKSVSAHAIAKIAGLKAPIWQRDHYSHIIRTPKEYVNQMRYVWRNPEAAGLAEGFLRKRY